MPSGPVSSGSVPSGPVPSGAARRLRAKLALADPVLRASLAELWRPFGLADGAGVVPGAARRYLRYLGVMHEMVRASVPLMERALSRCELHAPDDALGEPLARYLAVHIDEERHHDDWLLEDLAAAGGPLEPPVPSADVAALVGAQYYWIEHRHPVCLLGYMTVLEGHAPAPWLADRLAERTGLPYDAFRTVRHHAVLDTGHSEELDRLVDRLPLDAAQEAAVAVSALYTVTGVAGVLTRITTERGAPDGR
ncbi:iron-containing redox enzyme family protein [Streptomyces fuscichromogenes]|uniref:iron-containing redox enzyme family protein n=1 Tax=Streptomyces fuscichromogenes TaxID=1324013 RepID=UPI00381C5198